MQLGVSVVICCYNSATRLPETIAHLAAQKVRPGISWEVILIDNASTDGSGRCGREEWLRHRVPNVSFIVLKEPRAGKNYAYKKGVERAQFEYILTCDDDNRLSDDYIEKVFDIMQADKDIGVLGGCGIFDPERAVQAEIEEQKKSYINGPQTWAENDHWVYGAGSTCRRSVLIALYRKNWQQVTTGRSGTSLICGEDIEICFMFFLAGYKIEAADGLIFKHFVPLKRLNGAYLLKLQYWISFSYVLLNNYLMLIERDERKVAKKLDAWLIYSTRQFVTLSGRLLKQQLFSHRAVTLQQRLEWWGAFGTMRSLWANRSRLIRHHRELIDFIGVQHFSYQ